MYKLCKPAGVFPAIVAAALTMNSPFVVAQSSYKFSGLFHGYCLSAVPTLTSTFTVPSTAASTWVQGFSGFAVLEFYLDGTGTMTSGPAIIIAPGGGFTNGASPCAFTWKMNSTSDDSFSLTRSTCTLANGTVQTAYSMDGHLVNSGQGMTIYLAMTSAQAEDLTPATGSSSQRVCARTISATLVQ